MIPVITETRELFPRLLPKSSRVSEPVISSGHCWAGCWCMMHRHVATEKGAVAFINKYEWGEHTENLKEDESETVLSWLLNAKVRVGGSSADLSIYELVAGLDCLHGGVDVPCADLLGFEMATPYLDYGNGRLRQEYDPERLLLRADRRSSALCSRQFHRTGDPAGTGRRLVDNHPRTESRAGTG